MEIIQWSNLASWSQEVVLAESSFTITGKYNTRDLSWYCDITASDETPIISGRKLTIGTNILEAVTSEKAPAGIILVTPVVEDVEVITRDNMGVDVLLIFAGLDEIL